MKKRNKILSGVLALTIGAGVAMPMTAWAHDWDLTMPMRASTHGWAYHGHHHHRHEWRWHRDKNDHYRGRNRDDYYRGNDDYYRGYEYTPRYAYGYHPYGIGLCRPMGQGMINRRNPQPVLGM